MLPISHTFLTAFIERTARAPARQGAAAWAFRSSRLSLQPMAAPSVLKAPRVKGRASCLLYLLRRKPSRVEKAWHPQGFMAATGAWLRAPQALLPRKGCHYHTTGQLG